MRYDRILIAFFASTLAILAVAPAAAQTPYDGLLECHDRDQGR
jgi:hypothetical protein